MNEDRMPSRPHSPTPDQARASSTVMSFPLLSPLPGQVLSDLQSAGSASYRNRQLCDHKLAEIGVVNFAPVHLGHDHEAPGIGLTMCRESLIDRRPSRGEMTIVFTLRRSMRSTSSFGSTRSPMPRASIRMIMDVENGELRD